MGANTGQPQMPQLLGTAWLSLKLSFLILPWTFFLLSVLSPSGASAAQASVNWKNQRPEHHPSEKLFRPERRSEPGLGSWPAAGRRPGSCRLPGPSQLLPATREGGCGPGRLGASVPEAGRPCECPFPAEGSFLTEVPARRGDCGWKPACLSRTGSWEGLRGGGTGLSEPQRRGCRE